jgi:hypothetical protein
MVHGTRVNIGENYQFKKTIISIIISIIIIIIIIVSGFNFLYEYRWSVVGGR